MTRFEYHDSVHQPDSAKAIVPILMRESQPSSVVDVGCGVATFLAEFKSVGVKRVLGIDGPWADPAMVGSRLGPTEFLEMDLSAPVEFDQTFDLALSLEVAEHLPESSARPFVAFLCSLSSTVVFSAATPGQGGQGHINEQWPSYWVRLFEEHGYAVHDVLRSEIWHDTRIHWWYRQNLLLFTAASTPSRPSRPDARGPLDVVHPELFVHRSKQLDHVRRRLASSLGSPYHRLRSLVRRLLRLDR